jgi:stage V sporulation protein R
MTDQVPATKELSAERAEQKIRELLSNYEDGENLFIKANEAKTWKYPIILKDEAKSDHTLPQNWIALAERVFAILAEEKYGLDYYPNQIELVSPHQMLESYTSNGLPAFYEHWSLGKKSVQQERAYEAGQMGLAYELVINSDPCVSHCMSNNTPVLQLLVISHAAFGHNNFFRENHLFKKNTEAKYIVQDMENLGDFIRECEAKYGEEEVEYLLDACHALSTHSVTHHIKRPGLSEEEKKKKAEEFLLERARLPDSKFDFSSVNGSGLDEEEKRRKRTYVSGNNEENLLRYIADNAPEMHLPDWKRDIMRRMADVSQYFYPQMQTKTMNEGWASFWHWTLMHDIHDMGLIDDGMMFEFYDSHTAVLRQPDFDETIYLRDPNTGEPVPRRIYNGLNPYTMGFGIFDDIKRICTDPTEEDKEWFPDIAGNGDWLNTIKFAMENFNDSSFVQQYLSPTRMRDLKLFAVDTDVDEGYAEVTAIHDKEGFKDLRRSLSEYYAQMIRSPQIEVHEYHYRTDRHLVLRHTMEDNRPIYKPDMEEVLKHIHALWEHPIVLETVSEDTPDVVEDVMVCPPWYDDVYKYDQRQRGPKSYTF